MQARTFNRETLISLWISSPDTHSERKFSIDLTIGELKDKLERVTGIPCASQVVSLQRTESGTGHSGVVPQQQEVVAQLGDDKRTLGQYGAQEWMTIRVDGSDTFGKPQTALYTDTTLVEKFELTEQEYEARPDTVLAFKQRHRLGRFAASDDSTAASDSTIEAPSASLPPELVVGARCQVSLTDILSRRGTIRFIGPTQFDSLAHQVWVGVEWDEPVGKNNGSVEGVTYFETGPLRASFVKPEKVTAGDFPEEDPFAEDEEM